MKLLVDLGNTRLKWALLQDHGALDGPFALARPGAAEFERAWGALSPREVIFCSVAETATTSELHHWVRRRWNLAALEITAEASRGEVRGAYRDPAALGADRWANLLGARALLGAVDAVVLDAGTAVTADGLRADGRHVGGAIFAGLAASRAGLARAAPALPDVAGVAGATLPAVETTAALAAGTWEALAGACDRVARVIGADLEDPAYLLTGGDGEALAATLGRPWRHDPLLTMRGLAAARGDECAG